MHLKQCLNSHIQHINNNNFIQAAIVESSEKVPFKIRRIEGGDFFNCSFKYNVHNYLLKNVVIYGCFSVNSSILGGNMPKC